MIRGSCFAFVHRARNGHGVPSFRANRVSKTIPFCGYVSGNEEMLCHIFLQAGFFRSSEYWEGQSHEVGQILLWFDQDRWQGL